MSKKIISVVIPCKNQEDKIGETIDHIKGTAQKLTDFGVEIIFVNDRSTDKSAEVAKKHLEDYPDSKILHTDQSYVGNGKGMAVELGMTEAKGDYRLFMDADNSTKFEEVKKLVPYFDKYDIVLGTRYSNDVVVPSGNWFKSFWLAIVDVIQVVVYGHALRYTAKMKQGRLREFVSRGGNLAFTILLGQSFTDSRCGFKMYSKKATEKIFPLCRIKTWDFDSEALVLAKKFDFSMIEVPVVWYDDAGASNFKIKDMLNSFKAIFVIRWNQLTGRYDKGKSKKRSFVILGVLGVFIIGFLWLNYYSCSIPREIRSYISGRENVYVLEGEHCLGAKKFKRIDDDDTKNLPKTGTFEVVSAKENPEYEKNLSKEYTSVVKITASGETDKFIIYEVACASCGRK